MLKPHAEVQPQPLSYLLQRMVLTQQRLGTVGPTSCGCISRGSQGLNIVPYRERCWVDTGKSSRKDRGVQCKVSQWGPGLSPWNRTGSSFPNPRRPGSSWLNRHCSDRQMPDTDLCLNGVQV